MGCTNSLSTTKPRIFSYLFHQSLGLLAFLLPFPGSPSPVLVTTSFSPTRPRVFYFRIAPILSASFLPTRPRVFYNPYQSLILLASQLPDPGSSIFFTSPCDYYCYTWYLIGLLHDMCTVEVFAPGIMFSDAGHTDILCSSLFPGCISWPR